MNTNADMWVEFAKSFGMLFAVLAFFLLALYLVRRFSGSLGAKGAAGLIQVLSIHHLAPKEKLVLVAVQDKTVLIGVSPSGISRLARFDSLPETAQPGPSKTKGFQALLKNSLGKEDLRNAISSDATHSISGGSPATGENHE